MTGPDLEDDERESHWSLTSVDLTGDGIYVRVRLCFRCTLHRRFKAVRSRCVPSVDAFEPRRALAVPTPVDCRLTSLIANALAKMRHPVVK